MGALSKQAGGAMAVRMGFIGPGKKQIDFSRKIMERENGRRESLERERARREMYKAPLSGIYVFCVAQA